MGFNFLSAMADAQAETAPELAAPEAVETQEDAQITDGAEQTDPQEEPTQQELPQDEETAAPEQSPAEHVQTAEQRAGYAAARRRAEAELHKQKQAADAFYQRMDAMAKARGFASIDELEAAVNAEAEAKRAEDYKQKYGIDPNAVKPLVDDAVNNHPAVQAARQAEAQAKLAAGRKALDDAVLEIGKLDDRIKSFEDLPKMDNYEMFDDMVRNRGYRMVDAYKLANMDRLQAKRAAAASQETRNSINSRKHLTQTTGGAGETPVVVPADVKAMYKQFNPYASDAEIAAHWQKSQKN